VLVAALREGAGTPAVLSRKTGLSLPAVMAALAEAELDGWLCRMPGNQYEVVRRGC
jgi:predicted Rossmann fold nucleotide-binding protein DprA/Smf involved in DNA uptake